MVAAAEMTTRPLTASLLPLLVFDHQPEQEEVDKHEHETVMYSVPQQSLQERMENDLLVGGDSMCWTTPQGWMLLTKEHATSSPACLWNPVTGDRIPLPDIGEEHDVPYHCRCLLTHKDATDPSCVVVLLSYTAPDMWYCRVFAAGEDDDGHGHGCWHYSYDLGNCDLPEEYRSPPTPRLIPSIVAFQGKLYFVDSATRMCAIEFSSSEPPVFSYFNVREVSFLAGICSARDWLVESQDQLYLVDICFVNFDANNIHSIRVYKLDFSSSKPRWQRVRHIGDVVFLLEDANMAASWTSCTS